MARHGARQPSAGAQATSAGGNGGPAAAGHALTETEGRTISALNAAIAERDAQIAEVVAQIVDLEARRNHLLNERAQIHAKRVEEIKVMARVRGADPETVAISLDFATMVLTVPQPKGADS